MSILKISADNIDFLSGLFSIEVSWEVICDNIKTIAFHEYEKKMLECSWAARKSDIIKEEELFQLLLEAFKNGLNEKQKDLTDFNSYKQYVLLIADNTLSKCFIEYLLLLDKKHQKAWRLLSKVLHKRSIRWITQHTFSTQINEDDVFNEGIKRFYEKFETDKPEFENSYKLKSYFFKLIDFITKEESRKLKHISIEDTNEHNKQIWDGFETIDIAEYDDEEYFILKKGIEQLNETEKKILHGIFYEDKKLKEMAEELEIREENCRIIKFRALKKLRELADKNK